MALEGQLECRFRVPPPVQIPAGHRYDKGGRVRRADWSKTGEYLVNATNGERCDAWGRPTSGRGNKGLYSSQRAGYDSQGYPGNSRQPKARAKLASRPPMLLLRESVDEESDD